MADDPSVIQFDPLVRAFSSVLPYRTPFTLDVPAPKAALSVGVWFWNARPGVVGCKTPEGVHLSGKPQPVTADAVQKHFQVTVPALHAHTSYCVSIDVITPWTADDNARAVSVITAGLARLAIDGSVTLDSITAALGTALGADADALVQNRTVPITVKQAIREMLWGAKKSDVVSAMINVGLRYRDARKTVLAYRKVLQRFEAAAAGGGGGLEAAVKGAMDQIDAAKLDATVGLPETMPSAMAADIKKAMAALDVARALMAKQDCAKLTDKDKVDCDVHRSELAQAEILGSGAAAITAMLARSSELATATQNLAAEINGLVSSLVVPSSPIPISATSPSYTDAAPFYISGDVGITMPVFVNTSHSRGVDAVLYVAASVSLIPVDKDVPLAKEDEFLRRFSLVGGFTLGEVRNSDGSITGVFGGKGILGGFGYRLTDYVRLGAGAVIVRQNDTDRLLPDTHVRVAPYVSLSIDLDVAGVVAGIFTRGAGLHI
jgi:hypothetical protein